LVGLVAFILADRERKQKKELQRTAQELRSVYRELQDNCGHMKLLKLIQQGVIEKIGAAEASKVEVQIIAATHRNLRAMIEDGTFRENLYHRLAVIPLEMPSLRERLEDIPDLDKHLFLKSKRERGHPDLQMPDSLLT
jgi:transcriptional regulator with GAF, ATPase, and Fis domain